MRLRPSTQRTLRTTSTKFSRTPRRLVLVSMITVGLLVMTATALASLSFISKWGTSGLGDGQFSTPSGINVDSAGNVYVAEGNGNRGQKFDNNGNFVFKFGVPGDIPGGFVSPSGIAVDASGNIYVSDAHTNKISKFNSGGTFSLQWGAEGSGS